AFAQQRAGRGGRGSVCTGPARRHAPAACRSGSDRQSEPRRDRDSSRVSTVRLGLRANAAQFSLLVGLNALVGAMVGLERSVLPLVGKNDFGLASDAGVLAFVVAFGVAKAVTNLGAGALADRIGRKGLLVISLAGVMTAFVFVRDTGMHVAHEQAVHGERKALSLRGAFLEGSVRQPVLRACSQAGLVNNLNDALAWGLVPLYLAAHGA